MREGATALVSIALTDFVRLEPKNIQTSSCFWNVFMVVTRGKLDAHLDNIQKHPLLTRWST